MNGLLAWSTLAYAIFTFFLVIGAFCAACVGWKNVMILREHRRIDTLMKLLDRITSPEARNMRATANRVVSSLTGGDKREQLIADKLNKLAEEEGSGSLISRGLANEQKTAIEQTIAYLDLAGYFLIGHPLADKDRFIKEVPSSTWKITEETWLLLGDYVEAVQKGSVYRVGYKKEPNEHYGKYFKMMHEVAKGHI